MRVRFVWCAAAVMLPAVAGCRPGNKLQPPPPPKVTVSRPVQVDLPEFIETTGTTEAMQTVDLRTRVNGYLRSIHYKDGALVKKGDLLFVIEKEPFEAARDSAVARRQKAEATLKLAQVRHRRVKEAFEMTAVTKTDLDEAEAAVQTAEADVADAKATERKAKLDLEYTEIRAPFAGKVSRHLVDVGNLVQAETTLLTTMRRFDPIRAIFYVNERDFLRLRNGSEGTSERYAEKKQGRPVFLTTAEHDSAQYRGYVDYSAPRVDPDTGTALFRGQFANEDLRLVPGLFVRIRLEVGRPTPRLMIDDVAVQTDQRGDYLLILGKDDTVERRYVTLGTVWNGLRAIERGLKPDEWVVVNGLQKARPGSPVTPQRTEQRPEMPTTAAAQSSAPPRVVIRKR